MSNQPHEVSLVKEFKPTILFLAKFVCFYVVGSLLYGWYITFYEPGVDPVTEIVTRQSAWIIKVAGWEAEALDYPGKATTYIRWQGRGIVSVYEGCNSINVLVVFLSFMLAFGPVNRTMIWFSTLSIGIIYLVNLLRIIFLFFVVIYLEDYSYFFHKYLFTAFIYIIVLSLWVVWVIRYARKDPK